MRTASRGRITHTAQEQRIVDMWNRTTPVGTDVILTLDNGTEVRTKTRSKAWVMGGHTSVVSVEGRAGGYDIDRVRPV